MSAHDNKCEDRMGLARGNCYCQARKEGKDAANRFAARLKKIFSKSKK